METLTYRRPRIVALVILVLVVAGLSSLLSIGRQEDPTIANVFATVKTSFPGADPGRVETLVTVELERELREIPEIKHINSSSMTALSFVSIQLQDELSDDEIEQVWSKVRDALDDAALVFPQGVLEPEFESNSDGAYAAVVSLTADHPGVPIPIVGRYAEDLADLLRNIPGTKAGRCFRSPGRRGAHQHRPDSGSRPWADGQPDLRHHPRRRQQGAIRPPAVGRKRLADQCGG